MKKPKRSFGPWEPAFTTDRLRVFRIDAAPSDQNMVRMIFVACRNDQDRPMVTATAVVWEKCPYAESFAYLDWIEVTTECRREGLGEELWRGIEKHLGRKMVAQGATTEGDAMVEKLAASV